MAKCEIGKLENFGSGENRENWRHGDNRKWDIREIRKIDKRGNREWGN